MEDAFNVTLFKVDLTRFDNVNHQISHHRTVLTYKNLLVALRTSLTLAMRNTKDQQILRQIDVYSKG